MLYRQYRASFASNFVTPPVAPRLVSPETRLHVPANGNFPKPLNSAGLGLQPPIHHAGAAVHFYRPRFRPAATPASWKALSQRGRDKEGDLEFRDSLPHIR